MTGPEPESDAALRAAIAASLRQGDPLDPALVERWGRPVLIAIFRDVVADADGVDRLASIVTKGDGKASEAAAEVLGKHGGPSAGPVLARALEAAETKPQKKAIRRALHFFEAAHGRVPAVGAPAAEPEPTAVEQAWCNSPGPFGARLWLFAKRPPGQTPRLATVSLSDITGIRDFHFRDGSPAAVKSVRAMLAGRGIGLVEIPWAHLRSRLAALEPISETLPPNFIALRTWLGPVDDAPPDHPAASQHGALDEEQPNTEAVRALLVLPETGDWLLPPQAFEGKLEELREREASRLVVDGLNPEERVKQTLRAVLDEYLDAGEVERWRLRILDLALVLAGTGRTTSARVAVRIAADLERNDRSPIADAFMWALASRSVAMLHGGAGAPDEDDADDADAGAPGDRPDAADREEPQ